jgi:hypothetical protein
VVTMTACGSPLVSTTICRLMPDTFCPRHTPFRRRYPRFEHFARQ